MIRSRIILLLFVTMALSLGGCKVLQLAKKIKALKAQAEQFAQAFKDNDFQKMVDMTYPALVEKLGGETAALNNIRTTVEKLKAGGTAFEGITPGEPSTIVQAGKELHSVITQKISLKVPGGYLDTELNFLAVSKDKGKTWKFIDTSRNNVKELVPSFNDALEIPTVSKPVFRRN